MKFLADECCDDGMIQYLREKGIDVLYIQESNSGSTDSQVLSEAYQKRRILITEDKDFGELVYRLKKPVYGIILLRFDPLEKEKKIQRLFDLITNYSSRLQGNFLVLDAEKTRIRPLMQSS